MSLRLTYVGPTPAEQDGVPHMAGRLLLCLAGAGAHVHASLAGRPGDLPVGLADDPRLHFDFTVSRWRHDRWLTLYPSPTWPSARVELVVALSHRFADLADRVELQVIVDYGVWSDAVGERLGQVLAAGAHRSAA